jgi:enamine deaminase RidA (YjgF/YER057c/UK114 family)
VIGREERPPPPRTHARLRELGLELPEPPAAVASYLPVSVVPLADGRLLVSVSGQLLLRDGSPALHGRVGEEVGVEQAVDNARACALNVLAQLERAVGLDNVEQVLVLTTYVRCVDGFERQSVVANGASDLLIAVLGQRGRHARAAVGVNALPLGVPVELSAQVVARAPKG